MVRHSLIQMGANKFYRKYEPERKYVQDDYKKRKNTTCHGYKIKGVHKGVLKKKSHSVY